jgi:hypothetical protein
MLVRMHRKGNLIYCWWECKLVQSLYISMEGPQKQNIDLLYDPAIPLLGIYLKECKKNIQERTEDVAQVVDHLLSECEALSSNPSLTKK